MSRVELFNTTPKVKKKLNALPSNPEKRSDGAVGMGRFPSWLHRKLPQGSGLWKTSKAIRSKALNTVCEEAKCPNLTECWSNKTATFLAMGHECTRACGFCDIETNKAPPPLDLEEPLKIAESVKELGLKHVVITMVARDDLEDGGAHHLKEIVEQIRTLSPDVTIELLTSDLEGKEESIKIVLNSKPDILNHNIETVRRMTPRVRHKATYERTLAFLKKAKELYPETLIKSGLMVGLGEESSEVEETIRDLKDASCQIITIGQYLQASPRKLRVKDFVHPDQFEAYAAYGRSIGVTHMYSGPFVRSSYNAGLVFQDASGKARLIQSK